MARKKKSDENQGPTRDEQREADARAAVAGYEPLGGAPFDGARSYVSSQFDIAFDIQERYSKILEERATSREMLRGLYTQRLLTEDEAVLSFTLFPERKRKADDPADESQEAAQAA